MQRAKRTIAVVDDNQAVLTALAIVLESKNYEVSAFKEAADFVQSLKKGCPDLVITDMVMPKNGLENLLGRKVDRPAGLEILRHVNENFRFAPVIVMTGYGDEQTAEYVANLEGRYSYITKPFHNKEFTELVDKLVPPRITLGLLGGAGRVGRSIASEVYTEMGSFFDRILLAVRDKNKAQNVIRSIKSRASTYWEGQGKSFPHLEIAHIAQLKKESDICFVVMQHEQEYPKSRNASVVLRRDAPGYKDMLAGLKGYEGLVVSATNPVSQLCHLGQGVSGIPDERFVGFSYVDSMRLRVVIKEYFARARGVDENSVEVLNPIAYGAHGSEFMFPDLHKTCVRIRGKEEFKPLFECLRADELDSFLDSAAKELYTFPSFERDERGYVDVSKAAAYMLEQICRNGSCPATVRDEKRIFLTRDVRYQDRKVAEIYAFDGLVGRQQQMLEQNRELVRKSVEKLGITS